ncbi:MAG: peptidylprolyl isomerase [Caulobacteraceae bacterium]|nr:peptidylprolyl isomerase [Caulobacteraceae bacterium]
MFLAAACSLAAMATAVTIAAPAAIAQSERPLGEGVAAVVNDEIITSYDLRQRMTLIIATSGVRVTEQNLPQIQQQALRSLVDERLQMQELKRYQVNIPDSQVDEEIAGIAQSNNSTAEALYAVLDRAGVSHETLRAQIRAQLGWRILVGEKFRNRARIGEDQIDAALARMEAAATKPQYLIGEVYLDAAQVGGMDEAMNGANQLVEQLVRGAPFQAVARQFSNAASASNGGDGGWVMADDVEPEVLVALQNMDPGQLSRPIPTRDGVWIVYLREKREGGGAEMITLKQVAVRVPADAPQTDVDAAAAQLTALAPKINCESIGREAEAAHLLSSELGEQEVTALAPEFQSAVAGLDAGQVSQPVRTRVGVHLLAVCAKRTAAAGVPTRDQIGSRLFGQQLTMLAKRYLRDLRNSATIEYR